MSLAIITGASSGIGREFAIKLRKLFGIDEFWLIARNRERLEELGKELDCKYKVISADLTTSEGVDAYISELKSEKPRVDYLVNAAGFGKFGDYSQLSDKTVSDMIDLNIKAVVLITQNTVPYMNDGGRIIELGSGSCFTPLPHFNVYSSSKVFVLHYTKALNYELPRGIRATCFCPGWVATDFLQKSLATATAMVPRKMKPLLRAEKIVEKCIKASKKGRTMYVTNWYTKMQHLLFKLLPDKILTRLWLGMLSKNEGEKE